jgi:hypothetical protein
MKCPKCKKDITYLHAYSENKAIFTVIGEDAEYEWDNNMEGLIEYECPECSIKLFNNEEDAIRFLSKTKAKK